MLLLVETTIRTLAFFAGAMLLSLFIRKLPAIVAAIIGCCVLGGMAAAFLYDHWYFSSEPWRLDFRVVNSRFLVFYMGITATAAVVAIFRYRCKSRGVAPTLLVAGLALSVVAWFFWPWDMSVPFTDLPAWRHAPELPQAMRDGITFTPTGEEGKGNNLVEQMGELKGKDWNVVIHSVSLEGVQPPWFATMVDYHAVATLKSGRTIRSSYEDTNGHGQVGGLGDALRKQVLGLDSSKGIKWNEGGFEIFNYARNDYINEDLKKVSIKGVLTLEIRKVVLVKTLPFKAGGTVDFPRRHFMLEKAATTPDGLEYGITMNGVKSALRGDERGLDGWRMFSLLLFNRGEEARFGSGGSGAGAGDGIFSHLDTMNGHFHDGHLIGDWRREKPLPPDWADRAEIAFFTTELCGRIDLPYEIKSFDLKH